MSTDNNLNRLRLQAQALRARDKASAQKKTGPEASLSPLEYADNIVRKAASGLTFGWADKIAAKADEVTGRGGSYDENLAREQEKDREFEESHPVAATAAEVGGALMTGGAGFSKVLGAKAVKNAPRVLQYLASSAVGAGEGAIAGAGSADPDNRAGGATVGAITGGVIGGAVPVVSDVVKRRVWEPIASRLSGRVRSGLAGDYLERMGQLDGNTLDDVAATMRQRGPATAPVDTGRNMEALGMHAAQTPGKGLTAATDFVLDRRGKQFGRIMDSVEEAVGPAGKDLLEPVEGSSAFVKAIGIDVPVSGALLKVMQRPSMQKAWSKARKLAAEQDIDLDAFDDFRARVESGEITGVRTELMHYLKKGLDDVIEPKRGPDGVIAPEFGRHEMEALKKTRVSFRNMVRRLNPEYGRQLDKLATGFKMEEAFKKGQDFFGYRNPSAIQRIMKRMPERERRAFRMGVGEAIETRIMRNTEGGRDASSVLARDLPKLRAAFGRRGEKLASSIKNELRMMKTENSIAGGSQTAFRQNVKEAVDQGVDGLDALVDAGTGSPASMIARAVRSFAGPTKPSAPVMDEMTRMLFATDPRVIEALANQRRQHGLMGGITKALPHGVSGAASLPGLLHN